MMLGVLGVGSTDLEMRTNVGRVGIPLGVRLGVRQSQGCRTGRTGLGWAGLGSLGSWLRGKGLGPLGIVCIGGQPSVCTSQVCL